MSAVSRWLIPLAAVAVLFIPSTVGRDPRGFGAQPAHGEISVPMELRGPRGDAFYEPRALPADAKPGDLIWVRPYGLLANSVGYQIMYWSQAVDGTLVATSGVAFWPARTISNPRPIVAWAPGSTGLGDQCASSTWEYDQHALPKAVAELVVKNGAVFVATDYQGLATPGEHPYAVGNAEGRDVLNSIRAVAALTKTSNPTAVTLGESQGGGASLFAAELAPSYAPDIRFVGAVAVAPPSDLANLASTLDGGKYFGYVLMAINGIGTAYPDALAQRDKLTAAGRQALSAIRSECGAEILVQYAGKRREEFGLGPILDSAEFLRRLHENEPGHAKTQAPLLIVQGEADDTIPPAMTRRLVQAYCAAGVPVTAKFLPGKGHANSTTTALTDIVIFLAARMNGQPASSTCG